MPTVLVATGLTNCEIPTGLLTVFVMLLESIVAGEEQLGDPVRGAIVQ
jgi:hypothetical protein